MMTSEEIAFRRWWGVKMIAVMAGGRKRFPRIAIVLSIFYILWYVMESNGHDAIMPLPMSREIDLSSGAILWCPRNYAYNPETRFAVWYRRLYNWQTTYEVHNLKIAVRNLNAERY